MYNGWTKDELLNTVPVSSSFTDCLKKLKLSRTPHRFKCLVRDVKVLGIPTEHFKTSIIYRDEDIITACRKSKTLTETAKYLGIVAPHPSSLMNIKKRIKDLNLDTSHFEGMGWAKGRFKSRSNTWIRATDVLVFNKNLRRRLQGSRLKQAMLELGFEHGCEICNNKGIWNNSKLDLQVDHIDGNWRNNLPNNLRFLCPNCHSQTETFGVKNRRGKPIGDGSCLESSRA